VVENWCGDKPEVTKVDAMDFLVIYEVSRQTWCADVDQDSFPVIVSLGRGWD
jgi:hypothetical protein